MSEHEERAKGLWGAGIDGWDELERAFQEVANDTREKCAAAAAQVAEWTKRFHPVHTEAVRQQITTADNIAGIIRDLRV